MGDEEAIRRTLASYCRHVDDGRFAELVELFAPDGSFVLAGIPITGRTELRRFFDERQGHAEQRGCHLTVNTIIDVT